MKNFLQKFFRGWLKPELSLIKPLSTNLNEFFMQLKYLNPARIYHLCYFLPPLY